MAEETSYSTNDPRTQTKWSKTFFKYLLENMELSTLMGNSGESIIQVNQDLTKQPGDKVVFELEAPLTGTGIGDDGRVLDSTESLSDLNEQVEIHERGHAVEAAGKISMKRTNTMIQASALRRLSTWASEQLEDDLSRALSGVYNKSGIETVNEEEPSANRILYTGQTTAGVVTVAGPTTDALLTAETAASTLFGTKVIEIAKRNALLSTPQFAPVIIEGKRYFVMLVSRLQMKALRSDTLWQTSQQNANLRGKNNPLFSGAAGIWDGVVIKPYDRIQSRTGAGGTTPSEGFLLDAGRTATTDAVANGRTVERALFLGRQAGLVGWGQMPQRTTDKIDVNRIPTIAVDMMYGAKKTQFNSYNQTSEVNTAQDDYATLCIDTQVVVD